MKNYRLLVNAELEVDPKTTLIVGRNNTAKTSCFSCIENVLKKETIAFDDYPLSKRDNFYTQIALFMEKKLSYEELCKQIEVTSIEFLVDYSLDDPDDNLGALSPFIIDVDVNTTTALIHAEYQLKTDEKALWDLLESSYYKDGTFSPNGEEHKAIADNFSKLFGLTVYAINPNNLDDKQVKSQKELQELFPLYAIPAERVLGEDETHNSSLGKLISGFFDMSEAELNPKIAEEVKRLRTIVESANKEVQKQSDEILSTVVNNSVGFGYPNIEELKLQQFLSIEYAQFIAVRDFLYPNAQFSTEHGVKGEEYDNVVFVISKGWNQYQFETYAPMITGKAPIPKDKEAAYERNRNLFYVCCSRPKKRLFFFVTVPIEATFRAFLKDLVGEDNILTYHQFMKMDSLGGIEI